MGGGKRGGVHGGGWEREGRGLHEGGGGVTGVVVDGVLKRGC